LRECTHRGKRKKGPHRKETHRRSVTSGLVGPQPSQGVPGGGGIARKKKLQKPPGMKNRTDGGGRKIKRTVPGRSRIGGGKRREDHKRWCRRTLA